jgi:hypothetical protein
MSDSDVVHMYNRIMKNAQSSFSLLLRINLIIVVVGIVLLAYAIVYSAFRGLTWEATSFAGVGIADFVTIFLLNPQKKIQDALSSHTKVQIIYDGYATKRQTIMNNISSVESKFHTGYCTMHEYLSWSKGLRDELTQIGTDAVKVIATDYNDLERTKKVKFSFGQ